MSKLPAPSVSMPCDYRILQSPTKEQVKLVLLEAVGRSQVGINGIRLHKRHSAKSRVKMLLAECAFS